MEFKEVFALFPKRKSAGLGPHSVSELSADFNPSTLSGHQMPPEQLVDVPVPQVPERSSNRQLLEVLSGCGSLEEEEEDEDEERASFLISVRVDGAGMCMLAAFALVVGNAPSHTVSLNSIQTHGRAGSGFVVGSASLIMHYKFQLDITVVVQRHLVLTVQKTVDSLCSSWLVLHKLLCNDRCRGG